MSLNVSLIEEAMALTPAQISALEPESLLKIDSELNRLESELEEFRDLFHSVLWQRYDALAKRLRQQAGKDFGVVHLTDGPVRITVDLPKRVVWDQAKLRVAVDQLQSWGESADDYVTSVIKVSETRYNAWPPGIRQLFIPARTVKPGIPSFRLALLTGETS